MTTSQTADRKRLFGLSLPSLTGIAVVLLVVLFVSLNLFAGLSFRGARLDLTGDGLFTLSKGTVNTVKAIKEPIRLQFFYSEKIGADYPQVRAYANRVRDLLEEYAARSAGMIKLEVIDPEPFTEEEDLASAHGLSGAATQTGEVLFFGLVGTNAIDGKEVIAFFPQERAQFLEYDLTEMVHRLSAPGKPVLGIVSNLPLDTGPGGLPAALQGQSQPFMIYEQLRERFTIEMLEQDFDTVPESVDVLMIAHPKDLSERTLYAIDQFVLRGGRALVFVDPHSELSAQQTGPMGQPLPGSSPTSDLKPLLGSWGVAYDPARVVADGPAAQVVTASFDGRQTRVSYPIWLGLTQDNLNKDDLVTAQIGQLNLATAGALTPLEGAQTQFLPLITTSAESLTFERFEVAMQPQPEELLRKFVPDAEQYVIAARVTGEIGTAFPNGRPAKSAPEDGESEETPTDDASLPEHRARSDGAVNVIVVADSDLFDDRFWVVEQNLLGQRIAVPTADNANFIVNAVENLMGSNDLISLRGRANFDRPFTVVDELRRKAEIRYLAQEQDLSAKLDQFEQQLAELQGRRERLDPATSAIPSADEQQLVENIRAEMIETRRDLRDVRRSLRSEIEALGGWLAFLNIGLVPALVAVAAIVLARRRAQRRTQSRGAQAEGAQA